VQYGPKVPEIMDILGYDQTLKRIRAGLEYVKGLEQDSAVA
jgi:hypothetical protein